MLTIHQRPFPLLDRSEAGHWEGDLIIGRDQGSAIGALIERQTRVLRLLHLSARDSETLHDALGARMGDLPTSLLRSIAWDQGTEMARHTAIAATPGTKIYFCDSRSPWQGPSNENTNGLLRQYFPKGTDLSVHPPAHLVAVEDELNRRPRMVLEDRAPIDLFQALLASSPRRCCDVDWNSPRCEVLSIQPVPTDEVTWGVTPPALRGSVKGHRLDNGQAVAGSIRAGCLMPPLCGPPTARITASSMTYRIRIPTASGVITGGRGRSRPRDPGLIGHFIRRYWQGTTAARHTSTSPLAPAAPDVRRSRRPDVTRALIARN